MALIEIDETEYKNLTQLHGVAAAIMRNPKAAKLLEQARKEVDPNAPTPRLEQEREIHGPLEEARKLNAETLAAIEKDRAEREKAEKLGSISAQMDRGFQRLKTQDGWMDDGIEKLKDFMEKRGILDVDDAATLYLKHNPPPAPATPSGSGSWNFLEQVDDGEADLKKLIESKGESNHLLDKLARDALADFRGQGRR